VDHLYIIREDKDHNFFNSPCSQVCLPNIKFMNKLSINLLKAYFGIEKSFFFLCFFYEMELSVKFMYNYCEFLLVINT
jgi:hypothetical protein